MNIVKKIYTKGVLAILDFGAESVVVLIAEKKEKGAFQIVGAGDAVSHGISGGEVTNPGDATESISEALKKAERSSGTHAEKLYYNIDDIEMESVISRGSRFLSGEGEIQAADIEEAGKVAERLVGNFEKSILYFKNIQFIIDDRDIVVNPIGIFGKKLEVFVHVLQARSSQCESWQNLMRRSQISRSTAVPSAWSTAYGLLPKDDRVMKRLILDLGRDVSNVFIFENQSITGYKAKPGFGDNFSRAAESIAEAVKELLFSNPDIQEILITGELAQNSEITESLRLSFKIPARVAAPLGIAKLNYPKYASAVGLLYVADEIESKMPMLLAEKSIFLNVREKAAAFINEYF